MHPPRMRRKIAMQILGNVEPEWMRRKMGVLMDIDEGQTHQKSSFFVGWSLLDDVSLNDAPVADDEGLD